MKTLITLFTITSAFFLMSCSNIDQDLSPVGPEIEKISAPAETGTYPYLTTFASIPVKSFAVTRGIGSIEVVVDIDEWSDNLKHIYVMLEYTVDKHPSPNRMVYLEKPSSSTFLLEGFETQGLKNVKVYGYEATNSINEIQNPYQSQQSFNNLDTEWFANEKEIEILVQNNTRALGDTFAEITNDAGIYVTFLGVPTTQKICIPNNGKPDITNVKLYSMMD